MAKCKQSKYILKLYICVILLFGITMMLCLNSWYTDAKKQSPARWLVLSDNHVKVFYQAIKSRPASKPLLVSPSPVETKDLESIQRYHSEERRLCEQKMVNKTEVNWCPCIPPGLQGRVFVNMIDDSDWDRIVEIVGNDVLADQRFPAIFNKAATMNIGFLEAAKRFSFDCVIFHDVDMILEDDRCLMTCGPQPRHYARAVDRFNYRLWPTFGGVVSIQPELFQKINGYPLRYFGWGGEDDDMWSRVGQVSSIYKPPAAISRYSIIPHGKDSTNAKTPEDIK